MPMTSNASPAIPINGGMQVIRRMYPPGTSPSAKLLLPVFLESAAHAFAARDGVL